MHKFELGVKAQCKVTGLQGTLTARVEYLNGCVQYALTPKSDGIKYPDAVYLDQKQLEAVVPAEKVNVEQTDTGGLQINCPTH